MGFLCSVCIKGGATQDAILCTRTQTYAVTVKQSSNVMLLFPDAIKSSSSVATAEGILSSHFEVRLTPPRLQEIESLLSRCEYTSAEDEEGVQPMLSAERLSTEQLLRRVQASEVVALRHRPRILRDRESV